MKAFGRRTIARRMLDRGHLADRRIFHVEIVFADEDDGQVPDRGHIDAFVKGALRHRTVAEEADGHPAASLHLGRQGSTGSDADATTHYLSYWVRERGSAALEQAVHKITQKSAGVLGLVDRGTLAPGKFADINVFDASSLQIAYPEYVNDFPHGSGRFRVNASGYAATIVNGRTVTEHGRNTGERSGRVLREFSRG